MHLDILVVVEGSQSSITNDYLTGRIRHEMMFDDSAARHLPVLKESWRIPPVVLFDN